MREAGIEDRERVLALLESYENLLTPKQKEAIDAYYRYDLSLAEVAEEEGISRAGVSDTLKKAVAKLEEAEAKLGLVKKKTEWQKRLEAIAALDKESKIEQLSALTEEIIHGI